MSASLLFAITCIFSSCGWFSQRTQWDYHLGFVTFSSGFGRISASPFFFYQARLICSPAACNIVPRQEVHTRSTFEEIRNYLAYHAVDKFSHWQVPLLFHLARFLCLKRMRLLDSNTAAVTQIMTARRWYKSCNWSTAVGCPQYVIADAVYSLL